MINGLGQPQRVAVFGATSEIAQHAVRHVLAAGGVREVALVARDPAALESFAAEVAAANVQPSAAAWDASASTETTEALLDGLWANGDVDVALIAVGVLPEQDAVEEAPEQLRAVAEANFTGPAELGLRLAARMRAQGHGLLVVISSVAAERPRADNYVYGATKAGLDAFYTGLGDRLHGSGVDVLVVRPGFVHTRMTAGLAPAPLAAQPEAVGAVIAAGIAQGSTATVWAPGALRPLMAVMRHLPRGLFRRLAASRS